MGTEGRVMGTTRAATRATRVRGKNRARRTNRSVSTRVTSACAARSCPETPWWCGTFFARWCARARVSLSLSFFRRDRSTSRPID